MTRAIHSTRRHALEIQSNLKLLRLASVSINQTSFNFRLHRFIENIQSNASNNKAFRTNRSLQLRNIDDDKDLSKDIRSTFGEVKLFKRMIFNNIRFTAITYQTHGSRSDSCVLFKLTGKVRVGFIITFIQRTSNTNECIIHIRDAPVNRYLTINLDGVQITCKNVMFSKSEQTHSHFFIKPTDIVEKLVHVFDNSSKTFIFFRYPNMVESS